jgi:DNA-binding NtrC family response regulator
MRELLDLAERLRAGEDFEDVAVATLRHALQVVERAVASSSHREASVKRAMLHLRPGDGYAGLHVLQAAAAALSAPGRGDALLPSASAWKVLQRTGRPVAVDVNLRILMPRDAQPQAAEWPGEEELSERTRARLLDREATHLYAVPLHTPGGLLGMISLEATCPSAIGTPFVWEDCGDELEASAALAGPYLAAMPQLTTGAATGDALLPVIGPTMQGVVNVLRAFAGEDETLLIRGETGTGKSRIARWCHTKSLRADGPFELLDLLSVPDETQAGELFGWRKGAFTGAVKDHDGYVKRAEGGTLFLDEIDKLSSKAQASLLYLLEERRYRVLGDDGPERKADVRFIVGTNVNLAEAVREGSFREDLYYRVNVLPTLLPPLRDRTDEIADWARFMLQRRHQDKGIAGEVHLADAAAAALASTAWPGNLRQLDNVVRRAHTLAAAGGVSGDVVVQQAHVDQAQALEHGGLAQPSSRPPLAAAAPKPSAKGTRRIEDLTEDEVLAALERTGYRRAKAAEELGISRSSLYGFLARSKLIPKPSELTRDAIVEAQTDNDGDLDATAAALRVSSHGLKLRLKELGLGGG